MQKQRRFLVTANHLTRRDSSDGLKRRLTALRLDADIRLQLLLYVGGESSFGDEFFAAR